MSNHIPAQPFSGEPSSSREVPSFQGYQPPQPQPYQPSEDGWGSSPSGHSYAGQADPNYNPNAYAAGYHSYSVALAGRQLPSSDRTSQWAVAAFVVALIGIVLGGWLICAIAVKLAISAKRRMAESGEQGEGLATAAWWIGLVGMILWAVFSLFLVYINYLMISG